MSRLAYFGAVAAFLCSAAAFAADVPQGSQFDGRIQRVRYNAGDVTVVKASTGLGARIVFAQDETVQDIASGFSEGWEFSDRQNVLYIKPKSVKVGSGVDAAVMTPKPDQWDTNLMVKTSKRLYDFDLQLLDPKARRSVAYRVEFEYPEDEAAKVKEAEAKTAAKNKVEQTAPPRNWAYSMQAGAASSSIEPTMAYDDGRFTYLQFPNNREFPAVFAVAEDGSESIVNRHVDKDMLVVHGVVRQLNLRLGNMVVAVYNEDFDVDGLPPEDGTTVPGLARTMTSKEAKK